MIKGAKVSSAEQFARRISDEHLREHVFDGHDQILKQHCQLDHLVNTSVTPEYNLSALEILPVELQESVLRELDIKSLLIFRRVNKQAVALVNGLPEWRKITTHAAAALRMAIGIQTAHTITLSSLFAKLCQRHCDSCGKCAPYLDVFTLERCCLNVGGPCTISYAPMSFTDVVGTYLIDPSVVRSLPSFKALEGYYGPHRRHGYKTPDFRPSGLNIYYRHRYYDAETIRRLAASTPKQDAALKNEQELTHYHFYGRKLSAVLAPWLNVDSMDAVQGISCELCRFEVCMVWPQMRAAAREIPEYEPSNHMHGSFWMGWKELCEHVKRAHGERLAQMARSAGWEVPEYGAGIEG